jgi:uncharacterized protein YggE
MRSLVLMSAVLALAACSRAAPDPRGVDRDETLLTVSASGRAESRPDEARLQLGVQSLGANAGDASRLNRDKMAKVTAALQRFGVKPDDMQTRNLSLQRIDYGPDRGRFRADNLVEVKLRDMARVGEAVTAVTEAGANVVSGPELRVSDREAASRSAYAAAYRAARSRAEAYAGAAGLKVDRVLAIYDGGQGAAPPYAGRVTMEASATDARMAPVSAAPFSAGINASEVQVRVDFALTGK